MSCPQKTHGLWKIRHYGQKGKRCRKKEGKNKIKQDLYSVVEKNENAEYGKQKKLCVFFNEKQEKRLTGSALLRYNA